MPVTLKRAYHAADWQILLQVTAFPPLVHLLGAERPLDVAFWINVFPLWLICFLQVGIATLVCLSISEGNTVSAKMQSVLEHCAMQ